MGRANTLFDIEPYLHQKQQQTQQKQQNYAHLRSQSVNVQAMNDMVNRMSNSNYIPRSKPLDDGDVLRLNVHHPELEEMLVSDNENESLYVASPRTNYAD